MELVIAAVVLAGGIVAAAIGAPVLIWIVRSRKVAAL